jgi:hypothetical protein
MTGRKTLGGLLAVALIAAVAGVALLSGGQDTSRASPSVEIGVDTDISGNGATSLGTPQSSRTVNCGDTFEVDLFIKEVTDLLAWSLRLEYDPSVVRIVGQDVQMFQAANAGSDVRDRSLGDPALDRGLGGGYYDVTGGDIAEPHEDFVDSGSGVLARLTLAAIGNGNSPVNPLSPDLFGWILTENGYQLASIDVGSMSDAEVEVGGSCVDNDGDGIDDRVDNCPLVPNVDQMNTDAEDQDEDGLEGEDAIDGIDNDGDTLVDEDPPGDTEGDACDGDYDGDTVADADDNCPGDVNPDQTDSDGDGLGNACDDDDDNDTVADADDNCLVEPNADQTDSDGDGVGDACDDSDGDGILDGDDNCPVTANPDQADSDGDGLGDACDSSPTPTATPPSNTPTPTPTGTPTPTPVAGTVYLVNGWNDSCYVGAEKSVEDAFAGVLDHVLAVYRMRSDQGFDRWFAGRPEVSTIVTAKPYDQLFILASQDATWTHEQSGSLPDQVLLTNGWNSVCYTGVAKDVAGATAGIAGNFGVIYTLTASQTWQRYVPDRPEVSNLSELFPSISVLILVTAEGDTLWVFDP